MKIWRIPFSTHVKLTLAGIALATLAYPFPVAVAHQSNLHTISRHGGPMHIESSIQLSPDVVAKASKAGRDAYTAALSPYAKIDIEKATKIALNRYPGSRCQDIGLQSMRQNLVYIALLAKSDTRYLVVIDAGNGNMLATRDMIMRKHLMHRDMD